MKEWIPTTEALAHKSYTGYRLKGEHEFTYHYADIVYLGEGVAIDKDLNFIHNIVLLQTNPVQN